MGLERSVATKGTQGSSMSQVTDHFVRHATQLNRLFSELRHIRGRIERRRPVLRLDALLNQERIETVRILFAILLLVGIGCVSTPEAQRQGARSETYIEWI